MAKPYRKSEMGVGTMDVTLTVPAGHVYQLLAVSCHFSAAPSTSENLTITRDADSGSDYDLTLYSVDPSTEAATDILWSPDAVVYLAPGDAVDVQFANTDNRTWAVQVDYQEVY